MNNAKKLLLLLFTIKVLIARMEAVLEQEGRDYSQSNDVDRYQEKEENQEL